jgi:hypothetical protein
MRPTDIKRWNPRRWLESDYVLTLWCEHPGGEHPCEGAEFVITEQKEWLRQAKPYLGFVTKALKYGLPIAGAALAAIESDSTADAWRHERDLVNKISGSLNVPGGNDSVVIGDSVNRVDRDAFFEFRHLVLKLSENKVPKFGGLRRVRDTDGRLLWVCAKHDDEVYNPPLPEIPARTDTVPGQVTVNS